MPARFAPEPPQCEARPAGAIQCAIHGVLDLQNDTAIVASRLENLADRLLGPMVMENAKDDPHKPASEMGQLSDAVSITVYHLGRVFCALDRLESL